MIEETTEFQICWNILVVIGLATVILDVFYWRV